MAGHTEFESFFPEVDEQATVKNVKHFFKVDFPRMERVCHKDVTSLKSPTISDLPKAPSVGNTAEATIYRKLYAEQVVSRCHQALNSCDLMSQTMIRRTLLHADGVKDYNLMNELGYGENRYYFYKNRACLQFADAYLLDDLHVYR